MKIECPGCRKIYVVPDNRLPAGKEQFAFPCPACKGMISVDLRSREVADESESGDLPAGDNLKKRILKRLGDLPPMPQVVFKAQHVMEDPSLGTKELASVLENDQAMVTRVLRVANSAYYGLSGTVSSIHHATVLLGSKRVGEIISMSGASKFLDKTLEGYSLEPGMMWEHSLSVAFGSRLVVSKRNPELSNDAFIAGLIHDAGKMILDRYVIQRKEQFESLIGAGKCYLDVEKEILGFTHADIAYLACKAWGIPENLTTAIRFHHEPWMADDNRLAYAVSLADVLSKLSGVGTSNEDLLYKVDEKALSIHGIGEDDIVSIMCEMVESVQKVEEETQKD